MTAFFFGSPEFGLFCAVIILGWLIWAGIKSAGRRLDSVDQTKYMTWKEYKKEVGSMTWQERIVSLVLIAVFVAFVIWLAEVT